MGVPEPSRARRTRPARGAAIDIGSNAIRLQIAEAAESGDPVVLTSHRAPVRLGADVFREGRIGEASLAAAVDALQGFRELCAQYGAQRVRAVATSAVREAANRGAVVAALCAASPVPVQVISGIEEAWLLARAVESRVDTARGRSLLVDLGGGSVELTLLHEGRAVAADSYSLGALRLLELARREAGSAWGESFLALLRQHAGRFDHRIRDRLGEARVDRLVAVGGNVESLSDLETEARGRRSEGGVEFLERPTLEHWIGRLAALSPEDRCASLGLLPDRADVILPAAVVYAHVMDLAGVERAWIPRLGLRDALLRDVVGTATEEDERTEWRETLLACARDLAGRYRCDPGHAEAVRRHAAELFDQTQPLHGRGERERGLLEAAALLHDAGRFVSDERHHEHSAYLIHASELVGVGPADRELLAQVARYHRGDHPDDADPAYAALGPEDKARVCVLAALLRLADALDRRHRDAVTRLELSVEPGAVDLVLHCAAGQGGGVAEVDAVRAKGALFEEVFGVRLAVRAAA